MPVVDACMSVCADDSLLPPANIKTLGRRFHFSFRRVAAPVFTLNIAHILAVGVCGVKLLRSRICRSCKNVVLQHAENHLLASGEIKIYKEKEEKNEGQAWRPAPRSTGDRGDGDADAAEKLLSI